MTDREFSATPPIPFSSPAGEVRPHLPAPEPVPEGVLDLLRNVCPLDTDIGERAEHGRDWWPLAMRWALEGETPQLPAAVCRPGSTEEVAGVLRICHEHSIAVTAGGGRSGVCGGVVPVRGGIALDLTAMQGVESVDEVSGIICALAGTFGPDLERTARAHAMTVGHFPQSFDLSTVGGWAACRGAGQFSTRYGKIEDIVCALEVVTADGTVVRTGGAPAGAAGPDLTQLFLGSEGTLGVITRAWMRAHPLPDDERRAAYTFPDFSSGLEACRRAVRAGATPAVLRLYDAAESKRSHGGNGSESVLLVLDEGSGALLDATMSAVDDACLGSGARPFDVSAVEAWMHHRNETGALQALTEKGYVIDTMEVAANWALLDGVVAAVTEALLAVPFARAATCHLSHSYTDGACLYFTFAAVPPAGEFEATYTALWEAGQTAALEAGANLSHHHGVGLNRSPFMARALGPGLGVLSAVKDALDPRGILNPGKLGL